MMRPCRINPKLSADAFLEGHHDYNAVPFPPLGWRMLIFEGPDQRSSWDFHAVEGYSIGPAEENYRSYSGLVTSTGAVIISDTVVFPPRNNTPMIYPPCRRQRKWYKNQQEHWEKV